MADKKLILVFGATGAQGGSVVDFLLKDGKYKVRGVTRNVNSEKAKALAAKGVEVVTGDVGDSDPTNLKKAFKDVYGVFAVTNFWDPSSMGKEVEQGTRLADLAKEAGVKHYVWSTLPNVQKISNGKYHVPHFTDKAVVDEHIEKIGLNYTFVAAAFYYQNFASFFPPRKADDGSFVFTLPLKPERLHAAYDVTDTGGIVVEVFNNPEKYAKKWIPMAGNNEIPSDYFKAMEEVTGKKVVFNAITTEQFAAFGFPGAEEMAQMFGYFNEYNYFGPHNPSDTKKVFPGIKSFKEYLKSSGFTLQ